MAFAKTEAKEGVTRSLSWALVSPFFPSARRITKTKAHTKVGIRVEVVVLSGLGVLFHGRHDK